ncbi:MAG: Gfo/Idh/MocA family oxidoreductase [Planctomycetota bacterium]
MNKVRIGIVGSRFAADFHCDSYRRDDRAEIVAVAAIDNLEEISSKWSIPQTYKDYNDMFKRDDIDLVSVCVPNFLHHEVVLAAARAGKHILCEKPLATTVEAAQEMVQVCNKKRVKLFYGEDWCFAPSLMKIIDLIGEGAIGDVLYVKAKETHNGTHSPFAKNAKYCGGGCLIHLAIHPIGWILHLLNKEGENKVIEVVGKTNGGLEDNYVHKNNGGEDWAAGLLKFASGQHAFVEGNYITVGGMDDKVEIYGSEGLIKADLTFGSNLSVYSRGGYSYCIEKADTTKGWTKPAVDEFYNLGYVREIAYVIDCVLNDEKPIYGASGEMGLTCLEIIQAMYESSRQAKTIRGSW